MDARVRTYRNAAQREARDQLIIAHLEYVRRIARHLCHEMPQHVDIENLEAAGMLGLVEAAGRYDSQHTTNFQSYAYPRIRGAMIDELRRNCPVPQHVLSQWQILKELIRAADGTCDVSLLAVQSGLDEQAVESCLKAVRVLNPLATAPELCSIPAETPSAEAAMCRQEQRSRIANAIEELPQRERTVLTLYYLEGLTCQQIGDAIDLSESRVSRILADAELRLRKLIQEPD